MSDYDEDFDDDILAEIDLDTIESKFNNSGINVPLIPNELYLSKPFKQIAHINNQQQALPDQSSKPANVSSKPMKYVQAKLPAAYMIPSRSAVSTIDAPKAFKTSIETLAPPSGTEMTELQSTIHVKLPSENFIKSNHQLNEATKNTWVYPTNYSTRAYQFNISKTCLVKNTLVSLPTGLGKTFIAAVVMYNFYRWFTKGKIVFLAPTKPLVTQQIDACYQITGISEKETCELTGTISTNIRRSHWQTKRLFFMTPETIRNDLESGMAPINEIVLIVFDEAHRASGNYAYVEIVNLMKVARAVFRVLALSATPGNDTQKVQLVVDNLLIQALQLRSEEALDVAPYTHHREIIELVIPPTKELQELVAMFGKIIQPFLQKLVSSKVFTQDNPLMVRPFALISRRDAWRRTKNTLPPSLQGMIEGYFAISISMCSHLEKLMGWGIKSFYDDIVGFDREVKQSNKPSKLRQGVVNSAPFIALLAKTDAYVKSKVSSHPKMDKLVELVLEHFKQNKVTAEDDGQPTETRIMVFGAYRSVVEEMVQTLGKHGPLIRPTIFVGQAKKAGSKSGGMRQKEQLKVLQDFKYGTFNVLCATSIGEEGLDIGDIDLIICYDVNKSPIRMLQRSGRTGRKRKGKIILLLGQGNDESSVKKARAQYKNVQKSINSSKIQVYGGEQSSLITTETISCIMENFEIAVKKPVLKLEKCASKLEPLMNSDRLDLYSKKYFHNGYSIPSFTNYSHWQVSQLQILQKPHGTLSKLFTNMMDTLEKLKETENADKPSRSSNNRLGRNLLAIEPRVNKGDIESRSDDDFTLGAKRKIPCIDSEDYLDDRVVSKKKVLLITSDSSEFELIPGDPLNHNGRPDTNDSSNKRELSLGNDLEALNEPVSSEKFDDENLEGEIDHSSASIDNMVHDEIAIESLPLDFYPEESVLPPAPVEVPKFPSSPEQQLHSSLSEYDSFLNELDGIDFNELDKTVNELVKNEQGEELSPIITKISKSRRRVIISSSNHATSPLAAIDENRVPDGAKGRNSKMNQSAFNAFVDYEVEVSGTESDDETTEENRDLSGFVVSNPTTPHNSSASFYRKKRLSPLQAGYKFRKGYEIKPKIFTNKDYHYDDQEIDIPSSLKSFVVEDQEIDYQTQRYDPLDFDDEDIDQGFN